MKNLGTILTIGGATLCLLGLIQANTSKTIAGGWMGSDRIALGLGVGIAGILIKTISGK